MLAVERLFRLWTEPVAPTRDAIALQRAFSDLDCAAGRRDGSSEPLPYCRTHSCVCFSSESRQVSEFNETAVAFRAWGPLGSHQPRHESPQPKGKTMKRIVLLALTAGALTVPSTAGAQGGLSAGGIAACAEREGIAVGSLAPVTSLTSYPGPPGPFAGPNSKIDYSEGKNNGTDLIAFCQ
jgi:hypothetical protein